CIVLLYFVKKYNAKLTSKVLKSISIGMVFLDALIIIGYSIYSVFHFATGWGNGRNAIWSASVKVFQEYTPLEKLFGLGTDMIRERLTPLVGWNVGVANCHNNILECLLCLGAIGLVAYLFLWIAIVKPWFHKDRILWSAEQTGYFMALIAYFGQSIVGNPYSLTIPMAFMLLTLYRSEQSGRAVTL
ncbi:MAG: O-antigen ligase family protein, partial [Lachnospiraceae bacterium]|nr:O-antigen ligase family protein [Lachnospiraceae bacterium]